MISKKTIQKYEEGVLTLYGVYEECSTDLEMYEFLANYLYMDKEEIMENMKEVSGANDAYYNALSQMLIIMLYHKWNTKKRDNNHEHKCIIN